LPKHNEAPLAIVFLDVLQYFVGAGSAELWTESQIRRGVPDRPNLGRKFVILLLRARLFHLGVDLIIIRPSADTITARKQGNSCDWAWRQ
jgi:hypothetical protein